MTFKMSGISLYCLTFYVREWEVSTSEMEQQIPIEINDHLKIFGKEADEVDYNSVGPCPICGSRVDEFNFCACGGNLGCD
jgi:hypothetical protein